MTATQPVSMYAMRVPPGDVMVPALPQFASAMGLRVTMAAIDPSEEVISDSAAHKPRATLKVITVPADMLDDDDEDEDDLDDEDEDDDEEEDDEVNGGPSEKTMKKIRDALAQESDGDSDEEMESEDEAEAQAILAKLMKSTKGKFKALDGEDEDDSDDEDDEDMLGAELDECVVCTLDPEKQYQQPLDFTIPAGERIFFKVSGTHTIHLTGNYVVPLDDPEGDDDDYDLSPDEEDELDGLDDLVNGDSESDELDDLEDPRVTELDNEETAVKPAKKGKNKRPAQSDDEEEISLDDVMAKVFKKEAESPAAAAAAAVAAPKKTEEPGKKLTKAEKKAAKKQKNNDGAAVEVNTDSKEKTNGTTPDSDKKSVKFAKNLEQGPTPSAPKPSETKPAAAATTKTETRPSSTDNKKPSSSLGIRDINGVTVDDRKLGTGPPAKKGSRLEMRYIGKLESGKVFDSNKSGKPFAFKVGAGEVIKGWDLGLVGMAAGGERRLTIPASLAYGKKGVAGIPGNSTLIFDVKCLAVK